MIWEIFLIFNKKRKKKSLDFEWLRIRVKNG